MTQDFVKRLSATAATHESWLCVGIDPVMDRLPAGLPPTPAGMADFCCRIVETTAQYAATFKPNIAFFESLGEDGWSVLRDVVDAVPDDVPVILDAKRGDIGNTAERYAEAYYDVLGVDAVTINPYMGWDAVAPFATRPGKAAIVLCLTSNSSAGDFQELEVDGEPLFIQVARKVSGWEGTCGLVVGATRSDQLRRVRDVAPDNVLLIPGVGAQGGDLEESIRYGSWSGGGGALINASRSILYASDGEDFADAAAMEADRLRKAMLVVGE
jgi:orotidine-5'-phosphate decarboxylase